MKTIQLTQGFMALVDDEDYEQINKFKWCIYGGQYTSYAHYPEINITFGLCT